MTKNKYYIYAIFDPTKTSNLHSCGFEPFYVGKGCGTRADSHLKEENLIGGNSHKNNVIKKLRTAGIIPHIEILSCDLSEVSAYSKERKFIHKWGRIDLTTGPLTNKTSGGDGPVNKNNSKFNKKLINNRRNKAKAKNDFLTQSMPKKSIQCWVFDKYFESLSAACRGFNLTHDQLIKQPTFKICKVLE